MRMRRGLAAFTMTMLIGGRATAAGLESPWGLAYDLAGNLYISDQNQQVVR
jgi:hypothetical protein